MAHNGAKMTQTLAGPLCRNSFSARCCEESVWQAVAHNDAKRCRSTRRQTHDRGRGTTYRLPGPVDSSHSAGDSSHSGDSSHKRPVDSSHKLEEIPAEELTKMRVLAAPASAGMRLPPEETRSIILGLCRGRYLTANDLGELMNRTPQNLRGRFLTPLVEEGLLVRKYPAEPNRPDQAYTTK